MDAISRKLIQIVLLSFRLGWEGEINAALRTLHQINVGIDILYDKNLMEWIYIRHSAVYSIWKMEVWIRHWGGIAVTWRWDNGCKIEWMTH